jgi:signal transduction histidine kinase
MADQANLIPYSGTIIKAGVSEYLLFNNTRYDALSKTDEVRLPSTNISEFTFLNENLKDTIQKAQEEYLVLKEFSENASHELQTPFAVIRSKLVIIFFI